MSVSIWILNQNSYREPEYDRMVDTLGRLGIEFQIVKTIPFTTKIIPGDFDTLSYTGDIDEVPDAPLDDTAPIWVMGSYGLVMRGIQRGWKPCGWIDNLTVDDWKDKYPIVNSDIRVGRFWDVKLHENAFVRPMGDSKTFAGEVFTPDNWDNFQEFYRYTKSHLDTNEMVMVSSPKKIEYEVRYFVIDGAIIGKSLYVSGGQVRYSDRTPEASDDFARSCIASWTPNRAFVLDTAYVRTDSGLFEWRVLELNNFNAAGLYAVDVQKIIFAVQDAFFS